MISSQVSLSRKGTFTCEAQLGGSGLTVVFVKGCRGRTRGFPFRALPASVISGEAESWMYQTGVFCFLVDDDGGRLLIVTPDMNYEYKDGSCWRCGDFLTILR